jgi:hypothetical protein
MSIKCFTKWIQLNKEEILKYDYKPIRCIGCKKILLPFFVHDKYGDYTCLNCDEEGSVKFFCMKCRH